AVRFIGRIAFITGDVALACRLEPAHGIIGGRPWNAVQLVYFDQRIIVFKEGNHTLPSLL
ncbi:MAG: hypothetical protein ABFR50_11170, partial [Candidatus Fermentibacteria bacterium]